MDIGSSEIGLRTPSERERLIEAMIELGCERGVLGLRPAELVERSGVQSGAFERHFGSGEAGIEECMLAAEKAIIGDVMAAASGAYSADRSEWDSGIAGVLAILEYMAANPSVAYFGYVIVPYAAPARVREAAEAARLLLATMIDRLRESSEEDLAPPLAARAALGGADMLVRAEILAGRAEQLPRVLPDLVYGATVPFLGQEEAMAMARRARALLVATRWG
jgi:AcrR family transcriptional regulator